MSELEHLKSKIDGVGHSVAQAHRRIDSLTHNVNTLTHTVGEIKGTVGNIEGTVKPMANNLQTITDRFVELGIRPQTGNSAVIEKLLDVVKVLIIVAAAIAGASAIGYYGLQASGKHGETEVQIDGR